MTIDPGTSIGTVRLTVSDLERSRAFYEHVIGLTGAERDDGSIARRDGSTVGERRGDPDARALNRRATGLYHLAILLPGRPDLAVALRRLAEVRWPLDGASDHLVSEALYLSDPDGNGIEIYRDRPRADWPHRNGQLEMATLPLDLEDLLRELPSAAADRVPAGSVIGHVHLQVSDLVSAEQFYTGVLGLDVTVRGYPGALFVSAGGYHHHIGLNTWHSAGSPPPPPGSVGLRSFELALPGVTEFERTLAGVEAAGIPAERSDGSALVRDPSGNGVLLTAANGGPGG
jgi:catechol 2,3-dioxygenase